MWIELKILRDGCTVSGSSLLQPYDYSQSYASVKDSRTSAKIREIKGNLLNKFIRLVNFLQFKKPKHQPVDG